MSFSVEDRGLLERAEEVEVETQAPGKEPRRTVIWVVVDGEDVFIRTFKGPGSRWYRDIEANPAVAIHVNGKRLPASAIAATDPDSIERATAGYLRKYSRDPAVKSMVVPEVLDTTLRLEPT